tara:strand:+ start:161 stop:853 length:693 start_codon:yes stop_codon:yes gene_type:complete
VEKNLRLNKDEWCSRLDKAIEAKSGVYELIAILGECEDSDTWVEYIRYAENHFDIRTDKHGDFESITSFILRKSPKSEIQMIRHEMLNQEMYTPGGKWYTPIVGGMNTLNGFQKERYNMYMFDGTSQFNTFPGGVQTDVFHEYLVVELDDPKFTLDDLHKIVRIRIKKHIYGDETSGIELRTDGNINVVRALLGKGRRKMFEKWRFADDTFAKEIRIVFRGHYGMDEESY